MICWITCLVVLAVPFFELLASIVSKDEDKLNFRFNEKQQLEASIDLNGNETRYFYDEVDRLVKIVYPSVLNDRDEPIHPTETIIYGDNTFTIQDANGYHIQAKCDRQGQPVEIIFPDGSTQPYHSNTNIKWIDPSSNSTTESTDSTFTEDRQFLNDRGQYVRQRETLNAYGMRQIATHDALDRLENAVSFDSKGIKISETDFRYDARGNKIGENHHVLVEGEPIRSYRLAWQYDEMNRVAAITEEPRSSHAKTTHYHYNSNGQLDRITKPDDVELIYIYDEADQLKQLQASDHSLEYRFEYDDQQRLTVIHDLIQNNPVKRHYQNHDKCTEEHIGLFRLQNRYDSQGNRIGLILPDGSEIKYQYDKGRLETVQRLSKTGDLLYEHQYVYEAGTNQLLKSQLIKNLGEVVYQYDSNSRLIQLQSPWWSEAIGENGFDANDNLVQRTFKDPAGIIYQTLAYTEDEQLKQEEGVQHCQYRYDSLYNCLGKENEK